MIDDLSGPDPAAPPAGGDKADAASRSSRATAAAAPAPVHRQAVVVIHGIGEQSPMRTLRGFVDAVVPPKKDGEEPYYSRPDLLSDSFELRRLVLRGGRPRTDFYELYWAHRMPIASWQRVLGWLALLLRRRPSAVPRQLRPLWWISWPILAAAVLFFAAGGVALLKGGADSSWGWSALVGAALLLVQGLILSIVGDAAIYLSAHPRTVEARQEIRAAGIALLDRLHCCGDYDRIVIVGHSLGSVIGYDLINYLWQRYHERHGRPDRPQHPALRRIEAALRVGETLEPEQWHELVHALWQEQRSLGAPWLITDFVTLGSPLAHASLLMASSESDLAKRMRQREMPTAPPVPEGKGQISYGADYTLDGGARRRISIPHHGAPFAVTRWTNLYFPCRAVLVGDVVGGPFEGLFGPAVKDVAVATRSWRGLVSHTRYWKPHAADAGAADAPIPALREAMALGIGARGGRYRG